MTIKAQVPLGHASVREQVRKHNEEFDRVVREALNRVLSEEPPELKRLRATCAHQEAKLRSERVMIESLQQRLSDQHLTIDKLMGERAELLMKLKGLGDTLDHREVQLSKALCTNTRLERELREEQGRRRWLRWFS